MRLSLLFLLISFAVNALEEADIAKFEGLIKKHGIDKNLNNEQKYRAYIVLAHELDGYGFYVKAEEYYGKAIKIKPEKLDSLELQTNLLGVIYRQDKVRASHYYKNDYLAIVKKSKRKEKEQVLSFWNSVFEKGSKPQGYSGFFGDFVKQRDIKELVLTGNTQTAFSLLKAKGLEKQNINIQLQYDVLSKANGKRKGFFCETKLKKYKDSPAVTMEICRYLKSGKLKHGNLGKLKERIRKEMPHLAYLVKALEEIK